MRQVIAQRECINIIWLKDTKKKLNTIQMKAKEFSERTNYQININTIQAQINLTKGLIFRNLVLKYHK